jgi:hypothetical protein
MTNHTPKEPMSMSDPLDDFFTRERSAVQAAAADELHWERIVELGSARRPRRNHFLSMAAAAAVLVLAVGAGALVSRSGDTPSAPITGPSHPSPAPTSPAAHTSTPSPTATASTARTLAPVPSSFTVVSISTARAGYLVALGQVDCGTARCAALAASSDNGGRWGLLHSFADLGLRVAAPGAPFAAGPSVREVRFASSSVGWVFGQTSLRTTDGGLTWQDYPHPGGQVLGLETDGRDVVLTTANGCGAQSCPGPVSVVRAPVSAAAATDVAGTVGVGATVTGAAITWHAGHAYVSPASTASAAQSAPGPVVVRPDGLHAAGPARCGNGLGGVQLVGPAAGSALFATCAASGAMSHLGYAVLASTDSGLTWRSVSTDALVLVDARIVSFAAADSATLLAVSGGAPDVHGSMSRSSDGGLTWAAPAQGPPLPNLGWAWVGAPGGSTFFAISADGSGSLWRSTDRGQTWEAVAIAGH